MTKGVGQLTVFYLFLGIFLLVVAAVDFLWTTLWIDGGAGPLTKRTSSLCWKAFRKISRDSPRFLTVTGPVILSVTLLIWIFMLWAGWTFVFAGAESTIADSNDSVPISWSERIYYAGYVIFTLGIGDYTPKEGVWQVATILATGNGMLFITLAVTYILSVVGSVTEKRAFADSVTGAGSSGSEFVKNSWNGTDFHNANLLLNTFSSQLSTLSTQHKAYPILHFYHSRSDQQAAPVAVAVLNEALVLFRYGFSEKHQPNKLLLLQLEASIDNYLDTLREVGIRSSDETPSTPNLSKLREMGLPAVSDEEFQQRLSEITDRRKHLLGIVDSNVRHWPREEK